MFVDKCARLLSRRVCVSIVDLVTIRQFNLYSELLHLLRQSDPKVGAVPPPIYAVTCRKRIFEGRSRFESWTHPLALGQPLPTLPIWLSDADGVNLDLEACYEESCRMLKII
jgi:hypothetical protein